MSVGIADEGARVVALAMLDGAETLPAASKALTVYVYAVLAVKPVSEYEFVAEVPTSAPLRNTWYPFTPMLSVDAVQLRLICVEDTAVAARLVGAVGGMLSAAA